MPTGSEKRPWVFLVKWPGNHWKNSQWFNFEEALIAAGVPEHLAIIAAGVQKV